MPPASCEDPCDQRHAATACIYLKKKKKSRVGSRVVSHPKQHARYRVYAVLWKRQFSSLPLQFVRISDLDRQLVEFYLRV